MVRALGQLYNIECFRCRVSNELMLHLGWTYLKMQDYNQQVAEKFFPVDAENGNGQYALCETDYFRRLNLLCGRCGKALRGPYTEACGRKYHEEHMMCSICDFLIGRGDSYYEHEEKILCHYHYALQGAGFCTGCKWPITKTFVETSRVGSIENLSEYWHQECHQLNKFWNSNLATSTKPFWMLYNFTVTEKTRAELLSEEKKMKQKSAKIWTTFKNFAGKTIDPLDKIYSDESADDIIRESRQIVDGVEALLVSTVRIEIELIARLNQC